MKKLLLCVIIGLVAAILTTRLYDTVLDPQLAFFRRAAAASDAWEAKVRADGQPVYIFAGGSDVRMSIDPAVMLEDGVRAVNAGNNANMGMHCNASLALAYAKPGDTLVLCLYSNIMPDYDLLAAGLKFTFERRGVDMFRDGIVPCTTRVLGDLFRGESGAWCVYFSKKLLKPDQMFKYDKGTVLHESGWVEVQERKIAQDARSYSLHRAAPLPDYTQANAPLIEYIAKVKHACELKGVRLAVYLPRHFGDEFDEARAMFAMIALSYTRMGVPVIKDESFGVESDHTLFADTTLHLSPEGVRRNSRIISRALASPAESDRFWTEADLVEFLRFRGWNPDGSLAF